ncbi:MAG TPA: nitroreductase/quinone reductase family protein [Kouleothrix sp.]|uniref:nitroreductase/quinone reductase family protein n=1 Tax=Kouleothrix sp. TaxID=2779161 RepID=UPI002BAB6752|nr:nitroreductase/quinone reductase family protein [Kouleothrix sp.]
MEIPSPHPSLWQRLNQRVAATPLAARLFSRVFHHIDNAAFRVSGGRVSVASLLIGLPVVTLTTIGAKSGVARSVPLIGIPDGQKFVLIASNWGQARHPAWYYNLRARPRVALAWAGRTGAYTAREASGDEYAAYWERAVGLYAGYAAYKQRAGERAIPIVVLEPQV